MASIDAGFQLKEGVHKSTKKSKNILRRMPTRVILYAILILGSIVSLFPYWIALVTSLKPSRLLYVGASWSFPTSPTLQNYSQALTQYAFPSFLLHTIIFAVIATAGQLIFSTFAAYAFARMEAWESILGQSLAIIL